MMRYKQILLAITGTIFVNAISFQAFAEGAYPKLNSGDVG